VVIDSPRALEAVHQQVHAYFSSGGFVSQA
jgi:hypothetical protein